MLLRPRTEAWRRSYEVELLERCLQFYFQNYSVKLFKEEMK